MTIFRRRRDLLRQIEALSERVAKLERELVYGTKKREVRVVTNADIKRMRSFRG